MQNKISGNPKIFSMAMLIIKKKQNSLFDLKTRSEHELFFRDDE